MQRIWWSLRKHLHLIRRERSGFLTLMVFCSLAFGLRAIVPETKPLASDPEMLTFYVERDRETPPQTSHAPKRKEEAFFSFDPNELDADGFVSLGLSPKQAKSLLNYRERSGGFETKADLERVFVLPDGWFERHKSDILLPDRQDAKRNPKPEKSNPENAFTPSSKEENAPSNDQPEEVPDRVLDINALDSVDLVAIRGIGASSAQRILAYREALGGFLDTAQYSEVWGLHPAVRQRLNETARPLSAPQRIDLNTADINQLKAHPYISYKLARSLVAMRKHRGGKLTFSDLQEHHLIDDDLLERLTPYLNVD